ncbi:MAG: hypothetical protein AAFR61_32055 [Bacteroidota bacterium]
MHSFLSKLVPPALKRFDLHLLKNHPVVWASKIHYVIFYGGIGLVLAGLLGLIYRLDAQHMPEMEVIFLVSAIPFALGLAFWSWQANRMRVTPHFARVNRNFSWKSLGLFFLGFGLLAMGPVVYTSAVKASAERQITEETLIRDIRAASLGFIQKGGFLDNYRYWGPFFDADMTHEETERLSQFSMEMWEWQNASDAERELMLASFQEVYRKYISRESYSYNHYAAQGDLHHVLNDSHWELESQLEKAIELEYGQVAWDPDKALAIFFLLITGLGLLVYQQNRWQHFLLTGVTGIGLIIGLAIIGSILDSATRMNGREAGTLFTLMFFGLLILAMLLGNNRKLRKAIRAVNLNLATIALPFAPIVLAIFADEVLDMRIFNYWPDHISFTLVFIGSGLLGLISWAKIFQPKMQDLTSDPMQK